jgi:serine/threonine-protein kinase
MPKSTTKLDIPGYEVLEYLGAGARSTIWRVRDRRTEQVSAVKRVMRHEGDDDRFFEQAINEVTVAGSMDHVAIRKIFRMLRLRRWFRTQELLLFMECCDGDSCQTRPPSSIAEIMRVFTVAAQALAYMHSRGYVHADIKPNNIIVAPDATVKIIDLGQSCRIGTVKSRIQGTPDFIAPEQVRLRPLDGRTDVFNLGAALYWTLTGQAISTILPKSNEGVLLLSDLHVASPETVNPEVPIALSRLVMDCIEPQPTRRPESMRDVVARLEILAHSLNRRGNRGRYPISDQ